MLCPVCDNEEMLILEYNDVEIDYCNECSGIWLDEGELELLIGSMESESPVVKALTTPPEIQNKTDRPCPVCGKKMLLVSINLTSGEEPKVVEIDKCPRMHGLWFDNGELQDIISAAKGEPVAEFLSDLFSQ